MSTTCDALIAQDIKMNCTEPIVAGAERRGCIINRSDISLGSVVLDTTDPEHIVKTLPLVATKKGYEVLQPSTKPFTDTKKTLTVGTYVNGFDKELAFVILDTGPDVAKMVDNLANGDYVLILENKHKNLQATKAGCSAFEIFGFHSGLQASAIENELWSDDTRNGWKVTLKETGAPVSAMYLFNTDYATTKTAFESLMASE